MKNAFKDWKKLKYRGKPQGNSHQRRVYKRKSRVFKQLAQVAAKRMDDILFDVLTGNKN